MTGVTISVDKKVVENLIKTHDLIEELLETIEVMSDKKIMLAIKESEKELIRGETRPFREFVKEEGLE